MQDEKVLEELGFKRHPEWDWKEANVEHYKLEKYGQTFRAYVQKNNGPIVYVQLGVVCSPDGKVRWMDCVSNGSVERKILKFKPN